MIPDYLLRESPLSSFPNSSQVAGSFQLISRGSVFSITLEAIGRKMAGFDFRWELQRGSQVGGKQPGFQSQTPSHEQATYSL